MVTYPDARSVVRALQPDEPIILNRPHAAARAARFFVEKFPGKSLYAVKANPSPDLLQVLWDNGVTHYDVASIAEVRLVRATLPGATLCFMHPVKAPSAIREAYHVHGVRAIEDDRFVRLESANYGPGVRICDQLKGPPKRLVSDKAALRFESPWGSGAAHIGDMRENASTIAAGRAVRTH
ncbi:hypothetical protein A3727_25030 [Erythrobacter sp. HI0038]|nr:hypothetical protein A3727_25030 [Erythrobacter sp. HI0038]